MCVSECVHVSVCLQNLRKYPVRVIRESDVNLNYRSNFPLYCVHAYTH